MWITIDPDEPSPSLARIQDGWEGDVRTEDGTVHRVRYVRNGGAWFAPLDEDGEPLRGESVDAVAVCCQGLR